MKPLLISIFIAAGIAVVSCVNGQPSRNSHPALLGNGHTQSSNQSEETTGGMTATSGADTVWRVKIKPSVQVFMETSGSMNGYVNGGTSIFQQVVKEYLSGINNANFASDITYNYITSKVTPQTNDLNRYITKLTPSSFASNGKVATTDIGGIFKQILSMTDPNTISILISDCIISPGRNVDTKAYLMGQMTDVRDAIVNYTNQHGDLACLVYQFDSNFKGNYFDYENTKRQIDQKRPFYIWVFGQTQNIAELKLKYVPDRDFKVTSIRNQWMIFNTELSALQNNYQYGLLLPNTSAVGSYKRVDKTTVRSVRKPSPSDNFRFSFGVNMSLAGLLMGNDYVNDTRNYVHLVNGFSKQNFYGRIETDVNANSPYSNIFSVESELPFARGVFSLAFIPQIPDWAVECTDDDDRSFNGDNDDKTYGLDAIFKGIFNGYNCGNKDNMIAQFDFEIR